MAVHYAEQATTDTQVRELREVWKKAKEDMTKDERRRTKGGSK
jgi:hypothetical protein